MAGVNGVASAVESVRSPINKLPVWNEKNIRGKVPRRTLEKISCCHKSILLFYCFNLNFNWIFYPAREVARVEVAILENCRTIAKAIK